MTKLNGNPLQGMRFYGDRIETKVTRHNLTHWQQDDCPVFVTYRLFDSLPGHVIQQWRIEKEAWLKDHPGQWSEEEELEYHLRFSAAIDSYLDKGIGSCLLRHPNHAQIVANAFHHFDRKRYELWSYVVMPNHVHVVFTVGEGESLSGILQSWKGFTSREINRAAGRRGTLWQGDYFDRLVRSREHFAGVLRYIAENPIKAGLSEGEFLYWVNEALEREHGFRLTA